MNLRMYRLMHGMVWRLYGEAVCSVHAIQSSDEGAPIFVATLPIPMQELIAQIWLPTWTEFITMW